MSGVARWPRGIGPSAGPELGGGVFHSRDLAEISKGRVYLRGRASDQINVAGRKISPEAIEGALATHPSVTECVVFLAFQAPMANGANALYGLLWPSEEEASGEVLKHFLMEKLAAWQVPREWWFVDSFETSERGKLSLQ